MYKHSLRITREDEISNFEDMENDHYEFLIHQRNLQSQLFETYKAVNGISKLIKAYLF